MKSESSLIIRPKEEVGQNRSFCLETLFKRQAVENGLGAEW